MTPEELDRARAFTKAEVDLFRQWFNAIQDLDGGFLEDADYALAAKVAEFLALKPPARRIKRGRELGAGS